MTKIHVFVGDTVDMKNGLWDAMAFLNKNGCFGMAGHNEEQKLGVCNG